MRIVNRWSRHWSKLVAGALCAAALSGPAAADTLLDTGTPGGFLGYYGFDIFVGQSVSIAFTPSQNYAFDAVSLWLMSNDDQPGRTLTISLQTNLGGGGTPTSPSGSSLESWAHATTAAGWTPVLETMSSVTHPVLQAGTTYWIVAASSEPALVDPIWVIAGNGPMYTVGVIDFQSGPNWQVGESGGAPGTIVSATPVPEPAVLALALLGTPLVIGAARRRARAVARG